MSKGRGHTPGGVSKEQKKVPVGWISDLVSFNILVLLVKQAKGSGFKLVMSLVFSRF